MINTELDHMLISFFVAHPLHMFSRSLVHIQHSYHLMHVQHVYATF